MKIRMNILIVMALIAASFVGCNQDQDDKSSGVPTVRQMKSFYPEDIRTVNRIEMLRADGERKNFENKEIIKQRLDRIGEVNVTLNSNPQDHSGG